MTRIGQAEREAILHRYHCEIGGRGGRARAANLSPEERRAAASKAARARAALVRRKKGGQL